MGMYDYINGEQVKCFYTPVGSKGSGIWHSGGMLRSFENGDEVPCEEAYYKYPKNFIIFDTYPCCNDEPIIHVIKDGRVEGTYCISEISNSILNDIELFVDYYGTTYYNIKTVQDFSDYKKEYDTFREQIKNIRKDQNSLLDKMFTTSQIMSEIEGNGIGDILRPKIEDKLKMIVGNINSIDLMKTEISHYFDLNNIESMVAKLDEFKKVVYTTAQKYYNKYKNQFEKMKLHNEPIIDGLNKKFSNKWVIEDNFKEEKDFGELLDLLWYASATKDEEPIIDDGRVIKDYQEDYKFFKEEIEKTINNNPTIVDRYFEWLSEEYREVMKNTLDNNFKLR